jgi:hypothetical protein
MTNMRVSLGIVAWQFICGGVPYNIPNFVDSDDRDPNDLAPNGRPRPVRERIRGYLENNVDPGEFPEDVPGYLANGLKKCWNRNALSRPKAMTVAKLLQEAWLRLLQDQSNLETQRRQGESYTLTERTEMPISEPAVLEEAKGQAQSLVDQCRKGFSKKEGDQVQPEKIPIHHVQALVEAADASEPECALLVGASVWWELLDDKSFSLVANTRISECTTTRPNGELKSSAAKWLR